MFYVLQTFLESHEWTYIDMSGTLHYLYEMPRNALDFTISKKIGERIELRAAVKDILSEDVIYKQFPRFVKDGATHRREQTTRRYNPGQSVSVGVSVKF